MLVAGRENTELCPSRLQAYSGTCWLWEEIMPGEPSLHPPTHLFPLSASALTGISGSVDCSHLRATVSRTMHSCCIYLAGFPLHVFGLAVIGARLQHGPIIIIYIHGCSFRCHVVVVVVVVCCLLLLLFGGLSLLLKVVQAI